MPGKRQEGYSAAVGYSPVAFTSNWPIKQQQQQATAQLLSLLIVGRRGSEATVATSLLRPTTRSESSLDSVAATAAQ